MYDGRVYLTSLNIYNSFYNVYYYKIILKKYIFTMYPVRLEGVSSCTMPYYLLEVVRSIYSTLCIQRQHL